MLLYRAVPTHVGGSEALILARKRFVQPHADNGLRLIAGLSQTSAHGLTVSIEQTIVWHESRRRRSCPSNGLKFDSDLRLVTSALVHAFSMLRACVRCYSRAIYAFRIGRLRLCVAPADVRKTATFRVIAAMNEFFD